MYIIVVLKEMGLGALQTHTPLLEVEDSPPIKFNEGGETQRKLWNKWFQQSTLLTKGEPSLSWINEDGASSITCFNKWQCKVLPQRASQLSVRRWTFTHLLMLN